MKMIQNLFLLAVVGFVAFALCGGVCSYRIDSTRPKETDAYSYYVDRINSTSEAELEKVSLAIEWADLTNEISENEYNELQTLYNARKEG